MKKKQPFTFVIRIVAYKLCTMKNIKILSVLSAVGLVFASCVEHEVIPPPRPEVELECSFVAELDGEPYELVEAVDDFYCEPNQAKVLNPSPQPSFITYFASMRGDQEQDYIQIKLGRLQFNADQSSVPEVEDFEAFFNNNQAPGLSKEATNGVEIIYRDNQGKVWTSTPETEDPHNFMFSSVSLESDEENDYMKFVASFSCNLYDDIEDPMDTLRIDNAIYRSYFTRSKD